MPLPNCREPRVPHISPRHIPQQNIPQRLDFATKRTQNFNRVGKLGSFALKRILWLAPILALGACTTDDLESFAAGLDQFAYELDAEMNAPCPAGLYRQQVADNYALSYPTAPWQVDYRLNPLGGGYSYCAAPVSPYYYDDHDDHDGRHGGHGRRGDDDYQDGYRDGYRDGRRDD